MPDQKDPETAFSAHTLAGASSKAKPDLKGMLIDDLTSFFTGMGQPKFRADQIASWIFQKSVSRFESMTNLSAGLRETLAAQCRITALHLLHESRSTHSPTRKFLFALEDGQTVETVLIGGVRRNTLCISTQVGCAIGCRFCASGMAGLSRNMTTGEIVDQVIQARRLAGPDHPIQNIVVMGMGEPLANYPNTLRALRIINAAWGLGIGARQITISTSGLAPRIRQLADEGLQFELSVSLHAADDVTRSSIMPINNRYPLADLMRVCRNYVEKTGRIITFEYVLLKDVNDRKEDALRLSELLESMKCKVNLIPYNPVFGLSFETPEENSLSAFLGILRANRIAVTVRRERGRDIDAACGQLRLKEMQRAL